MARQFVSTCSTRPIPLHTLTGVFCFGVDYSGEFSHWNFSMQIKRNMDSLMASSPESVGSRSAFQYHIRMLKLITSHRVKPASGYQSLFASANQSQVLPRLRMSSHFSHPDHWPLFWSTYSSSTLQATTTLLKSAASLTSSANCMQARASLAQKTLRQPAWSSWYLQWELNMCTWKRVAVKEQAQERTPLQQIGSLTSAPLFIVR